MTNRFGVRFATFAISAMLAFVAPAVVMGQTESAKSATGKGAYVPPRTPDGQPDISGLYEPGVTGQPMEVPVGGSWKPTGPAIGPTDFGAGRASLSDPARAQVARSLKPMIVDPPDGKIPMQPWVREMRKKMYDGNAQEKAQHLDPRVRCLQAGIPRAHLPVNYNSYQIMQKPGYVVMVYEWNHMTRIIPLDGRPHLDPKIRLAMGDPRGHWEGNTLVVDSTNFNDDGWVLGHGAPGDNQPVETFTAGHGIVHSPELHVVERFTPVDGNIIHYEARIEDPKAFTQPFTLAFDALARGRPDHELFEYACQEGNRDTILMVTGIDIDPTQKEEK